MNLQTLSTPLHIHPKTTWSNNFFGGDLIKPIINQRFSDGFCNRAIRVSKSSFRLKNGGHLIRVCCHNALNSNNNRSNDDDDDERDDGYYMRKCVGLAKTAIGCTTPNPMVGCVIVKDGKIVGRGFHPMAGQPHAEVFALRDAGDLAENATAYVSLEPCNHYGRTPPCSEALVNAKVKKVVVGMVDPNPIVSSKGIDRLREAGIEVVVGIEEDLCKKLNEAFIHKMLYGKPFVTVRYSISINGVALNELEEEAVNCGGYYSKLLQEYDAVIHLPQTTQEFSMTASHEPNAHQPLHILIAKNVDSPLQLINLPTDADFKAIVFAEKEVALDLKMSQMGIEMVVMDPLSLQDILEYCSRQGLNSVLVDLRGKLDGLEDIIEEGFDTNLLQKIVVEVLPFCADSNVSSSSILSVTQRRKLKSMSSRTCGKSILLEGYF